MEYVLTFQNTHFAVMSEQYLLANNLQVTCIPLPSELSAGCGISLRLNEAEIEAAVRVLREKGIGFALYARSEGETTYTRIENEIGLS